MPMTPQFALTPIQDAHQLSTNQPLIFTYYVTFLSEVLSIQPVTAQALLLSASAGILPVLVIQVIRKLTGLGE